MAMAPEANVSQPNGRMLVAISTAMIGAIMFGLDCGNFGAVQGFDSFLSAWCAGRYGDEGGCAGGVHEDGTGAANNNEWLSGFVMPASVLLFVGAAVGSLALGPVVANQYGRRLCIFTGAAICLAGCLLTSWLAFGDVPIFFFGRFVTGFGIGVCTFALPLYNAEVSAPSIRGATGALFQVNVVVGQLIASVVCFLNHNWKLGMMLPGFAAIVVSLAVWLTPESPRYVMAKVGLKEGAAVLAKLRTGSVDAEAQEVADQLQAEKSAGQVSWFEIAKAGSLRRRVIISCWLQFAQQFTGMNTIIMFSAVFFEEAHFGDPFSANMVFTALMVVGIIAGLVLLDSRHGGRRVQLLAVTLVICPLLLVIGIAVHYKWSQTVELVLISAFAFTWQVAWGMIPWVYPSELFTMAERDRATSLAVFTQYAANAVLMFVVPLLKQALGFVGMVWFFSAFNVLNVVFILTCIKETKGIPLEHIPQLFNSARVAKAPTPALPATLSPVAECVHV